MASTVNKMNNAKSSMINMRPTDDIKQNIFEVDQSETHRTQEMLPQDCLYKYHYQLSEQHRDQKR